MQEEKKLKFRQNKSRDFYLQDPHMYINNPDNTGEILDDSFEGKKLLTLGGAGNFFIDSTIYGVKDITIFDIHRYQYYLIALKLLAIQKLPYEVYFEFLFNPDSEKYLSLEIMEYLFSDVEDYASISFWKKYIELKRREEYASINLFTTSGTPNSKYLQSKKEYGKARESISDISGINYLNADIKELDLTDKSYDRIYLGNMPSSIDNKKFDFLIKSLKKGLSSDGEILYYIRDFYVPDPDKQSGKKKLAARESRKNSVLSRGKMNILSNIGFEVTPSDIKGSNDVWVKAKKRH